MRKYSILCYLQGIFLKKRKRKNTAIVNSFLVLYIKIKKLNSSIDFCSDKW